jgi:hypothetical protein
MLLTGHPPLFIMALWRYTKNVWKFRNQIVQGSALEESAKIAMATLSEEVTNHYRAFKADTNYVLPRHEHLFPQWSLQQLLALSYNYITCWVQSVKEARSILQLQDRHLHQTSRRFFSLFHLQHSPDMASSDDDSTYSLSTIASAHTTSTTLTLMSTAYYTDSDNSSDTLSTASTLAYLTFFPNDDTTSCNQTQLHSLSDITSLCSGIAMTPLDETATFHSSIHMQSSTDNNTPLGITTESPHDINTFQSSLSNI